jgi:hypothetical protein
MNSPSEYRIPISRGRAFETTILAKVASIRSMGLPFSHFISTIYSPAPERKGRLSWSGGSLFRHVT